MKKYALLLFLFISFGSYAQNSLNNYKYVVVPAKFSFQKQSDQYNLNSLTKYLLEEKGFTVYIDNNLPAEIANNKCQALNADVLEKSGMFSTALTLVLKDCQGNTVFQAEPGKNREKDYNTAYNLALRETFNSLNKVQYTYNGVNGTSKQETTTVTPVPQVANTAAAGVAPAQTVATVAASPVPVANAALTETTQPATGTLYAQSIANGYQLIDTTPKIVLTLLKSSVPNYFIASDATNHGIVLKKGDDWYFEYYKDGKLNSEKLSVKF